MFDVLGLLPVAQWLLQRLDDEAGGVWFHVYLAGWKKIAGTGFGRLTFSGFL